jgi:hypothetical protein
MSSHITHEIDGYLVEFDRFDGWRCKCGRFEQSNICEHTQSSAVMRAIELSHAAAVLWRMH